MFVLPTLSDAGPMSPMEAMGHGCPAIFSCVPYAGIAEVVKSDEAILLQNPKNAGEIARAIEHLLDPAIRKAYAIKGEALARQLSWDQTAETVSGALEKSYQQRMGRLKR